MTGPAFVMPATVPDGAQLWLVRHGETEWSRSGQHTGRTDIGLTDAGRAQAVAVGTVLHTALGGHRPYVMCSPLTRARDTAQLAGLVIDEFCDDLREWDYGTVEGQTAAQLRAVTPGWTVFRDGTPGGETVDEVGTRADRALELAAAHCADRPVVLVAHGHICRVIAARWIGLPAAAGAHLLLGTAAPSLLSAQYSVPVIDRWNIANPAG